MLSQKTSLDCIERWWKETCAILQKADVCPHIICVDANAPLGFETSDVIGTLGAEASNPQGIVFQSVIETMKWYAPSTFADCHQGPSTTWRHPKGAWLRRDYILTSESLQSWCHKSFVDSAFDSGKSHIDHLPVVLSEGFVHGACSIRMPKVDPSKVADPQCQQKFRQALATLPLPTWSVGIDSHCMIWEKNVLELAQQIFAPGPPQKKKHRPQISDDALQAIQFKRHVLQLMRHSGPLQYEGYKKELRVIEKDVRQKVIRDQSKWYEQYLQHLQESGEIHDSKAVFSKLHRLGGGKRAGKTRPLPMMKNAQGDPAQSFEESQQILFQQFAQIEEESWCRNMS